MTGPLSVAEFVRRADSAVPDGESVSPATFKGFGTKGLQRLDLNGARTEEEDVSVADGGLPVRAQSAEIGTVEVGSVTHGLDAIGSAQRITVHVEPMPAAVVDTVPRLSFADGVVALDSALRGGLRRPAVTPELLSEVAEQLPAPKRRRARFGQMLDFADPLAESPGKSLSRVRCHQLGFAAPELQVNVTADGRIYRVDFWWEGARVVGEFDGWMKYRQNGGPTGLSLQEEKIREAALRSIGLRIVRWYWEDLMQPERLARKLLRAGVPQPGHRASVMS